MEMKIKLWIVQWIAILAVRTTIDGLFLAMRGRVVDAGVGGVFPGMTAGRGKCRWILEKREATPVVYGGRQPETFPFWWVRKFEMT